MPNWDWKMFMHWKYVPVVIFIISALALRPGAESSYQLPFLALFTPMLFYAVASLGYKEPLNVLVLGSKTIIYRFQKYAKPGLAERYKNRRIVIYSANEDAIPDKPFDVILLALDLNLFDADSLQHEQEILEAERKGKHFGETIFRHFIVVLGYDRTFAVPDNIPDAIETRAPDRIKEILVKCERRWVEIDLDNHEHNHIKRLTRLIDKTILENCGPIKHRIILLGGTLSVKNSIGHLIFNEDVFGKTEPTECVAVERVVSGKRVLVVNTPSIQPESVHNRDSENQRKISESILLTSPGPRVFVMVIKDTEKIDYISASFKVFETRFGMEAYRHLIVVLKQDRQDQNIPEPLRSRLGKLEGRLIFDNGDIYPTKGNSIQRQILSLIKKSDLETKKKELSLVLIGPSGLGKSHTANNLLGLPESGRIFAFRNPQRMKSRVSVAMRSSGEYEVVIADTPSLGTHVMSNVEVLREIMKCAFYPNQKPRPICVILRCDRTLYQREQENIQFIQRSLPDNFSRTSMVLFTRKNYMELQDKMNFREYLKQTGRTEGPMRTLLSGCHWRCVAYENTETDQSRQNKVVYTLVNHVMNPDQTLQLILVGHTGSGKSASGNTIVSTTTGAPAFNASFSQTSNTEECQIEEFEVAGKRVRLVDTPGLFDTRPQYNNETTMTELCKSILYTLPGPHAFLFVISAGERFTRETRDSIRILKQTFGEQMLRHMVVIFTRLDELQRDNRTVESIIREIRPGRSDVGKEFFDKSGEYVAFDNRPGHQTGNEAYELLEAVKRVVAANEQRHFTNKTYDEIVQRLKWYGTGTTLNLRYQFERNPVQLSVAVGILAGLGMVAVSATLAPVAIPLAAGAVYFANQSAP